MFRRCYVCLSRVLIDTTVCCVKWTQISKFMGPTWGPPGCCRPQMGPMMAQCNIGYPSETHLQFKSREISFVHNTSTSVVGSFRIFAQLGNDTAVLYVQFQNDLTTRQWVMDKQDFARFEFKMRFERILYIAKPRQGHGVCVVMIFLCCNLLHWMGLLKLFRKFRINTLGQRHNGLPLVDTYSNFGAKTKKGNE